MRVKKVLETISS